MEGVSTMFITLEGPEGSGKTTVSKKIIEILTQKGYEVIYTREPGGSEIAESIRNIILDKNLTLNVGTGMETGMYLVCLVLILLSRIIRSLISGHLLMLVIRIM